MVTSLDSDILIFFEKLIFPTMLETAEFGKKNTMNFRGYQ
jgi:hypothetical protein